MNIVIHKLTPDLVEDYLRFFDTTPHWDKSTGDELPCYCVTWRSDDSYVGNGDHYYPTREERRERAGKFVQDGKIQGYLAYSDDKIVGWCNATADCQGGINYLREYYTIDEYDPDVKVKSIFCFMIAPEMQRAGIATMLVERVCIDAAAEGFDFVEAYPSAVYTTLDYSGPLAMYEKCGFIKSSERDGKTVVRKAVK